MKNRLFLFVVIITTLSFQSVAQPAKQLVQVIVSPNKTDWTYDKGQQAEFTITVLQNNIPLIGVDVRYTLGPEKMTPWDEGTIKLDKGLRKRGSKGRHAGIAAPRWNERSTSQMGSRGEATPGAARSAVSRNTEMNRADLKVAPSRYCAKSVL